MENPGILKWHTWSAARKGMVIGALIAALMTILLQGVCLLASRSTYFNGLLENIFGYFLAMSTMVTYIPRGLFCRIFNWNIGLGGPTWWTMCLDTAFNAAIFAVIGGVIGCVAHQLAQLVRKFRDK